MLLCGCAGSWVLMQECCAQDFLVLRRAVHCAESFFLAAHSLRAVMPWSDPMLRAGHELLSIAFCTEELSELVQRDA